jgi:hypothetical protein
MCRQLSERNAILGPQREPARFARAQGKVLPGGYLFPGLDPVDSMSTRQLNRAVHEAAVAAHRQACSRAT